MLEPVALSLIYKTTTCDCFPRLLSPRGLGNRDAILYVDGALRGRMIRCLFTNSASDHTELVQALVPPGILISIRHPGSISVDFRILLSSTTEFQYCVALS